MNKTWIAIVVIVILAVGGWFIFGSKNKLNTPKTIKIGISQIISHPAIDAVRLGIVDGFAKAGYKEGDNVVFDFQNAQGDNSTNVAIAQKFSNEDYDLFIPISTPSSQAIANLIKSKPIVFSAVTDPITAGLVK
jgi:putative tryptophan/tyrosine transport system substrate-binding protein